MQKAGGQGVVTSLLRRLVLLSHSAVRDANLLLLDTASVQREQALNALPRPGLEQQAVFTLDM